MDDTFVPGLRLAGEFYATTVRPLLAAEFPALRYAAALLGPGSEILGLDTERSTDHDWGPRLLLFIPNGAAQHAQAIVRVLDQRLPGSFRGNPVAFGVTSEPDGVARHRVRVVELGAWLTWYPRDVWRYVLSCQWGRIAQEEAFPGRCAEVGDELGSAVVTARLARDLMRLWLLMHRRYPPYSKWLGTAFARVPGTAPLAAALTAALAATDWPGRERHLVQAYVAVAEAHNALGLAKALDPGPRRYYERPFWVLDAGRFAAALTETMADPDLRRRPPIGAADQFIDSTDALGDLRYPRAVVSLAGQGALTAADDDLVM